MPSGVGKGRPAMLLLVLAAVSVNTGKAARPIVPCATPDTGRRFVSPLSVRSARPTSPARQQRLLVTPHLRRRSISDPPSFPPGPCSLSGVPVRTPSSICRSCRHERRRICNGAVNRRGAYEANESWWVRGVAASLLEDRALRPDKCTWGRSTQPRFVRHLRGSTMQNFAPPPAR